jgi:hypothetical protein
MCWSLDFASEQDDIINGDNVGDDKESLFG